MAKLRKMLGRTDDPEIVALMRLIETQNRRTLARFAADYARENWLPVYEAYCPQDDRVREAIAAAAAWADGTLKATTAKEKIRAAVCAAKDAQKHPAAQAAARAAATAAGVMGTPTNALGMCFYGAAAVAYHMLGVSASAEDYDQAAAREFERIHEALSRAAVSDEPDPAKINWNC
ncbi:MAG: putative immunity protein [Candidatus Ventricola sp.]